nr:facilitated trehalose transporter Tret1-like [Onthophagus taurus]
MVGTLFLSSIPAAILTGWSVDHLGRKKTLLITTFIAFLNWLLLMFANSVAMLIIGRAVAGVAMGCCIPALVIYIAEISEEDIRGKTGTYFMLLKAMGTIIVLVAGPYISYLALLIICACVPLISFCTFFFMPESPFYYIKSGNKEEAKRSLLRLSKKNVTEKFLEDRLEYIERTIEEDMKNKGSLKELLTKKEYRFTIFLLFGIKSLQQFNGNTALEAYIQPIIESSNSGIEPEIASIIIGCIQLPAVYLSGILVDKLGRKPLFITSTIGCGIALFGEGTYFLIKDYLEKSTSGIGWIPTAGLALFWISNPIGIMTLPYVLLGELFPTNIKAPAVGLATFYGGVTSFLVSKFFKPLSNAIGIYTVFYIFCGICVAGCLFIFIFLPETKGKNFQEIQAIISNKKNGTKNNNKDENLNISSIYLQCVVKMFIHNQKEKRFKTISLASLPVGACGMFSSWASPALSKLQSNHSPLGRPISDEEGAWVVSIFLLSATLSCVIGGYATESLGRKKTMVYTATLIILAWLLIAFGKRIEILYLARIFAGAATGISILCGTIYCAEIADEDIRGQLTTLLALIKILGSLYVLAAGPYISYKSLGLSCSLVPILFFFGAFFMPESPYYFARKGMYPEMRKQIEHLYKDGIDEEILENRVNAIKNTVEKDMMNKTTIGECLFNRQYRRSSVLIGGIKTIQQLSGCTAVEAYMQRIIELAHSKTSPEISSVIFGSIQLPAIIIAGLLVDKIGRRPLFILSALGSAFALIGEGAYFFIQDYLKIDTTPINWIPTTGISLYLVMNPLGISTLPYLFVGEFFPTNIKGAAVSISTIYGGFLAFMVSNLFKPLSNVWGVYSMFWFFATICLLGAIFVYFLLPETKGKAFSEIQEILNGSERVYILKKNVNR